MLLKRASNTGAASLRRGRRIAIGVGFSTVVVGMLATSSTAKANIGDILGYPFRWLGGQVTAGGVDKLKPALDATIRDVDSRVTQHETRIAELAKNTIGTVDHALEQRLLQAKIEADDLVDRIDDDVEERIRQIESTGVNLIAYASKEVSTQLDHADQILRGRIGDLNQLTDNFVRSADEAVKDRIEQLDEVAGRRLGDVDVIATKQRLALERAVIQVAVIIGLITFVGFVVRGLWTRYSEISAQDARGIGRMKLYVQRLYPALLRPLGAAVLVSALFGVLYAVLPSSAAEQAIALQTMHIQQLEASTSRFDYVAARFHASQLGYLDPALRTRYEGLAAKAGLLRDLAQRETMLLTREGIASFRQRVESTARQLYPSPDPDLLVMQAVLAWESGATRIDEHKAASLAARALRIRPRGFPLAPLARAYVEAFLDSPFVIENQGLSRDSATVAELREALVGSPGDRAESPFDSIIELSRKMRRLERVSTEHYISMIENQAEIAALTHLGKPRSDELAPLVKARSSEARLVVRAWADFDTEIRKDKQMTSTLAANLFRLNDAVLMHARWFAENPDMRVSLKRLEELPRAPRDLRLRLFLTPARIIWARRYQELFAGATGKIAEFDEAERFRQWEQWLLEFEQAMTSLHVAQRKGQDLTSPRARVVVAASKLGLYVNAGSERIPYARKVAAGQTLIPAGSSPFSACPESLDDALALRGPRLL